MSIGGIPLRLSLFEKAIEDNNEYYLEIDEFIYLFKHYSSKNNNSISSDSIIHLICHYFPDIIIDNNKYILGISTNIWNKNEEILNFFEYFKSQKISCSSLNELYSKYIEYVKKNNKKNKTPFISINYFNLFISEHMKEIFDINPKLI